jgi:uncharacterized RDD family membrane protein YckC
VKSRTTIIAVVILLLPSLSFAADFLAGDTGRIWLVQPAEDGKSCNVFAKSLGGSWEAVVRNQSGVPTSAVAVGDALHLFYADRQHVVIDPNGQMEVIANLPGERIAACAGEDFDRSETGVSTVFVLVRQNTPPVVSSTSSQPATAATTASASPGPFQCLYRLSGNQWTPVGQGVVTTKDPSASPTFLAILNGQLYRLDLPGDDPKRPYVLYSFFPAADGAVHWKPVYNLPADQRPLGLIALKDRLLVIHTANHNDGLTITRYTPAARSPISSLPITRNQAEVHWPADAAPSVSRLGGQVAILWRDGKNASLALCSPSGVLGVTQNVTKALEDMPNVERANQVANFFLLAVIVILGFGMFFRRMRTPPQPFVLARGLRPGNLFKRLLALCLDVLPFSLIAVLTFGLNPQTLPNIMDHPQPIPRSDLVSLIYASILTKSLYVVYGTIMELYFGATLGKRLFRLRAVREDGRRPDLRAAVLRNVTKIVELSMFESPMAWLLMLFVLLPLLTRNRQRLGDMIARTAVVEAASLEAMEKIKTNNQAEIKTEE